MGALATSTEVRADYHRPAAVRRERRPRTACLHREGRPSGFAAESAQATRSFPESRVL